MIHDTATHTNTMIYQIARRLYSRGSGTKATASATNIATAGVAVGILVMVISLSITTGFQEQIRQRVAQTSGHVQIINCRGLFRNSTDPIQINDSLYNVLSAIPGVNSVQRYAQTLGILKTDSTFLGITLRGTGPDAPPAFISHHLTQGIMPHYQTTSSFTPNDSIIISENTALRLRLHPGDRAYAYFFNRGTLKARRLTIAAIFQTHLSDIDNQIVLADARLVQQLMQWQPDQYSAAQITITTYDSIPRIASAINRRLIHHRDPYGAYYASPTVSELHPQIFSWLSLLDTNVIAILILMTLVAIVTMTSGLLIIILERTPFIGIMKAMGATNTQLRHIFLSLAIIIILRGVIIGNSIALLLLIFQHHTHLLTLDPVSYYLSYVPVAFPWVKIAIVNIATIIISTGALIIPSYIVSHIHPARSIKFE